MLKKKDEFGQQKLSPGENRRQMLKTIAYSEQSSTLAGGHMRLRSAVFLLHPPFFQIESQSKEEKLCPYIGFSRCQKPAESKICLEQSKSSFRLYGSA